MEGFKAGQMVYTLHGEECEYVASAGGKHVVVKVYENDDGHAWGADEVIVDSVFTTPPTQKLHAEVGELEAKSADLRKQLSALRGEVMQAERDHKARMAEFAKLEPLKHLEDVLAGRITHYVVYRETYGGWYGDVEILASEEALSVTNDYGRRTGELKLLCLFGDSKGNLAWRRNYYRDGSGGGWDVCEPFTDEQAARDRAKALLNERFTHKETRDHQLKGVIENCDRYGFDVPDEARARHSAYLRGAYEAAVAKAKDELAKAEAALLEVPA